MESLVQLKDLNNIFTILKEIDSLYFQDLAFSITTQKHNIQELIKYIKMFYIDFMGVHIFEEELGLNNYLTFEKENDFIEISQIIAAIAAQCSNKEFFIGIMQNELSDDDQKVMFNILNSIIYKKENLSNDEINHEDKVPLSLKFDVIESENKSLRLSNESYIKKLAELIINNNKLEQNLSELEQKYSDLLISSTLNEKNSVDSQKNVSSSSIDDCVNLSIQLSEIRGKLEAKEQVLLKVKEEKDKIYMDLSKKNFMLKQENDELKEKNLKYDLLKENFEKNKKMLDEMHTIRFRNNYLEKLIKQSEEKLKKFKNSENDKNKLLKRIEELNCELSEEKEKSEEFSRQLEQNKELLSSFEKDFKLKFSIKKINTLAFDGPTNFSKLDEYSENEYSTYKTKSALSDIENDVIKKQLSDMEVTLNDIKSENEILLKQKNDLENKIKVLLEEKENYFKEKHTLDEKIRYIQEKNKHLDAENKNYKQKLEKYTNDTQLNIEKRYNLIIKNLESESVLLKLEIKKLKNIIENSESNQIEKSSEWNLTNNNEVFSNLIKERSYETIEDYKLKEKILKEQEKFLLNLIFEVTREFIFKRFIKKDK